MFPDTWKRFPSRVALLAGALVIAGLGQMARGRLSPDTLLSLFFYAPDSPSGTIGSFGGRAGPDRRISPASDRCGVYPDRCRNGPAPSRSSRGGRFRDLLAGTDLDCGYSGLCCREVFRASKTLSRPLSEKTWEGALAGVAGGLFWGLSVHRYFLPAISMQETVFISLFISVWGQVGDLCESAFKRAAGIKDSGSMIPGHGGVLDRIDSLLFNSVALYAILALFEGYSSRVWL